MIYVIYRQVSNIRRTLVGNKIVDHSDVVGDASYIRDFTVIRIKLIRIRKRD